MAEKEGKVEISLGAAIESSAYAALDLMDSMSQKTMDLASDLSESAGAVQQFAGQIKQASGQLEGLQKSHAGFNKELLVFVGLFSAATAGIVNFVKSAGQAEMQLQRLARSGSKTIEAARASDNALQAMGKTLREVQGSGELYKAYNELVKINKEMRLPNMADAIEGLKGLRMAFWEFRSTAKYVTDWIGARVLKQLDEPIRRITERLREVAKWLRTNLDSVTMKISSAITGFIKGVMGVVEGFTKVIELVGKLDPNIRKVGSAILFVIGLLKTGPIGQILTLLTLIGGVIDDFQNFQYNVQNGLTAENPYGVDANGKRREAPLKDEKGNSIEYIPIAFYWENATDAEGNLDIGKAAESLMERATKGLQDFWQGDEGKSRITTFLSGEDGKSGLIGAITSWFTEHSEGMKELGTAIAVFVAESIKAIGGEGGGFMGQIINTLFGDGTIDESVITDNTTGATFAATFGAGVGAFIKRISKDKNFIAAVLDGAGTGAFAGVLTSVLANITDENGDIDIKWEDVKEDMTKVGESIVRMLAKGIELTEGAGQMIFQAIGKLLMSPGNGDTDLGDWIGGIFESLGSSEILGKGIIDGLTTWLATGNFGLGLIGAISGTILHAANTPDGVKKLKEDISKFWNGWTETVGSVFDDEGNKLFDVTKEHKGFYNSMLDVLFGEETDEVLANGTKKRAGGVWDSISNIFVELFSDTSGLFNDIWNGTNGNDGLGKVFSDLWDGIWGAVVDWWSGPEVVEAQYGQHLTSKTTRKGGFSKVLRNLIFGDDGSFDPLGLVSGFNSLWNGEGENGGLKQALATSISSLLPTLQNAVTDLWEGELVDKNKPDGARKGGLQKWLMDTFIGTYDESTGKGDRGFFDKLWKGEDGTGGLRGKLVFAMGELSRVIADWWYGPESPFVDDSSSQMNIGRKRSGGFSKWLTDTLFGNEKEGKRSLFDQIWKGQNGNDGLESKLSNVWDAIVKGVDELWRGKEENGDHHGGIRALLYGDKWGDESKDFDQAEGIIGEFIRLFNKIAELAGEAGSKVWKAFFQSLPASIQELIAGALNLPDMNGSHIIKDEEGQTYLESENKNKKKINAERAAEIEQYLPYLSVASNGRIVFTKDYTGLENDTTYGAPLYQYMESFLTKGDPKIWEKQILPIVQRWEKEHGIGAPGAAAESPEQKEGMDGSKKPETKTEAEVELNTENAEEKLAEFTEKDQELPVDMEIDNESEFKSDVAKLVEADYGAVVIRVVPDGSGFAGEVNKIRNGAGSPNRTTEKQAWGGRIGREMDNLTVGEDGPEYIIPITKPSRARDLIKQMFGEMGASAVQQIIGDLGIGSGVGTIGSDYASIASALSGGSSVTNNNTVSAPVTINVQASGVGAEDVGERAYDAAQRHLMRTLKGVFA